MNGAARLVGRYRLGREIGRGERGIVYEATEPASGRLLALKIFRTDLADEPARYAAQLGERLSAVSRLDHPGVVRVVELGLSVEDGQPWVAMERVEGRSLRQLLDALPRMSFEWVRSIGAQAAEALAYAQKAGIVHGGLKAGNLLIDGDGRVVVTDFALPAASPGALPAVPQYLSPEQVQGLPADARSDVFSLGALLFEMLVGRPPFGSPLTGSLSGVLEGIAHAPTPSPSALDPEVPPDLDFIVMKALAKSPVDRHADAGALARALRAANVDMPRPPTPLAEPPPVTVVAVEDLPAPPFKRGQPGRPGAPVDDVLAELEADLEAFSARSLADLEPKTLPLPRAPKSPPDSPLDVAFPRLLDAPVSGAAEHPGRSGPASATVRTGAGSSLLADLAGEAQRIRAHAAQMQRGERAARTEAEQALADRLLGVRDYFSQLVAQLNVIRPQVSRDYPLLGLGVLRGLAWHSSDVHTRNRGVEMPDQIARVSLSWLLQGQAVLHCERDPLSADALRGALREHGVRFEEQPQRDEHGRLRSLVFDVAPEVRARVELAADYEWLSLKLTLQNVERFGLVDYLPPRIGDDVEWLDELVRLMLGQPSRFASLVRLVVPTPP
ncbi:serine/threonine-protein kinase [Methyloversatilis thermotolerans]|uniref:serine/threonine-protein kinase n=1 Tax=Methyloversatilis thermotolerans TaxID=1346290 RepID=UPI00037ADE6E|nr:serine/threonine-protein kinase [Methyloversatilis thermotolerans]